MRDNKGRFIKTNSYDDWVKHPRFKNGKWAYRKFKKDKCEECSSNFDLQVHHIDHNRENNSLSNLLTLCRNCHWKNHKGNRTAWNKGLKTGSLSKEHKEKIGLGVRKHYA